MTGDKPYIIPFKREHILESTPRESFSIHWAFERSISLEDAGIAFSGFSADHKLMGCAGIIPLHPGVGNAWFIPGPAAEEHAIFIVKQIKQEILNLLRLGHYRRIQTAIPDNKLFIKLATMLGMKYEGILREFGHTGEDYRMYSILEREI